MSGSFAPCPVPALAGRHDDADVICLTRGAVNTPHLAMRFESEQGAVSNDAGFFYRFIKDANVASVKSQKTEGFETR